MDEYQGEMDLADGNRASFVLTVAPDGKAVTECGFLKQPTKENIAEFEDGMRMILEDLLGQITRLERVGIAENPELARQQREAFLRGGSNN
jgi:hypothetical protein